MTGFFGGIIIRAEAPGLPFETICRRFAERGRAFGCSEVLLDFARGLKLKRVNLWAERVWRLWWRRLSRGPSAAVGAKDAPAFAQDDGIFGGIFIGAEALT
jgi:hypothetical protein